MLYTELYILEFLLRVAELSCFANISCLATASIGLNLGQTHCFRSSNFRYREIDLIFPLILHESKGSIFKVQNEMGNESR